MKYSEIKMIIDKIFAFILLIALLPLFLITSVMIILDDFGNPFFLQDRIGKDCRKFKIIKFRTMIKNDGKVMTQKNDSRITKVGKILRKYSIDELPQLINILKGDMSFIGPRPDVYTNLVNYNDDKKYKYKVTPGITGLSQVNGRSSLTIEEKLKYDHMYVNNFSMLMDIKIILKTIAIIISQKGVN